MADSNTKKGKYYQRTSTGLAQVSLEAIDTSVVATAQRTYGSNKTTAYSTDLATELGYIATALASTPNDNTTYTFAGKSGATSGANFKVTPSGGTQQTVYIDGMPTSLPASDVKDWAKADNKPTYNATEIAMASNDSTTVASKIATVVSIAEGKTKAFVAPTNGGQNSSLAVPKTNTTNSVSIRNFTDSSGTSRTSADVKVGDIIYTSETTHKDWWVSSVVSGNIGLNQFDSDNPDLTNYQTKQTTLSGYGITDAKISNGVITLGSNTITPLTSSSDIDGAKVKGAVASATSAGYATNAGNASNAEKATDATNATYADYLNIGDNTLSGQEIANALESGSDDIAAINAKFSNITSGTYSAVTVSKDGIVTAGKQMVAYYKTNGYNSTDNANGVYTTQQAASNAVPVGGLVIELL